MTVEQVAQAHYQAQQAIVRATVEEGQALWAGVQAAAVMETWLALLDGMEQALTLGQMSTASLAQAYIDAAAQQQGVPSTPFGIINPAAFAGWAADGRALGTLLMQPALSVLALLAAGVESADAMRSGLASLTRILWTETADAGRAADGVGIAANGSYVVYVRKVVLPACGRCVILAGREYSWSTGFLRHPQCDCQMIPVVEQLDKDRSPLRPPDPEKLFAAMTPAEQNRAFTNAGAQAIRDGADIGQTVNSRRGMTTAGGMSVTTEGTTARGIAGRRLDNLGKQAGSRYRRSRSPRLTPEQIYIEAAGDRAEAVRLLKRFSYIT